MAVAGDHPYSSMGIVSDEASCVTGSVIVADGGRTA